MPWARRTVVVLADRGLAERRPERDRWYHAPHEHTAHGRGRRRVHPVKDAVEKLYNGRSRRATRFRYALIAFDALTIVFFIATAPLEPTLATRLAEAVIGLLIASDVAVRLWIARDRWAVLRQLYTLADLVVIASLLLDPVIGVNLAFLKVLRATRLIDSYRVLRDLRRDTALFRKHEDAAVASVNLFVFVFVSASIVFVLQFDRAVGHVGYVDALYFTVATLTTAGYGDIVPETPGGKLLTVLMMLVGVALFVRLARAIFLPNKAHHTCPQCDLTATTMTRCTASTAVTT